MTNKALPAFCLLPTAYCLLPSVLTVAYSKSPNYYPRTMVTLKSFDGGEFDAYLALPASGYGPGIVVLQEIFGVNSIVRGVADWYAAHGFVALCPDIFWRQDP